ncbi:hypothetical protein H9L05_03850 [Hymenobacter qilianensis]|uniref:Uncharacterized protein n=1 Tax=Hymenobacter qilianensis TaxID=1385715 RepID=A0A7H0GX43_9BACT|nr:hypothetical protein [Hymenobacter qilianensis]QNP52859.1 hypothetical protein H9L05_03850 [Hymenobacter qilianensis]
MKRNLLLLLLITALFGSNIHQPLLAQSQVADYTYGGATEEIFISAVATADGGIVAGATTLADVGGDITQPPRGPATGANFDFWIVRLDAQGNKLWDKRYGGTADDRLVKIVVAPMEDSYSVAGPSQMLAWTGRSLYAATMIIGW